MNRRLTRRTVTKLAYATPLIAASMRMGERPVGAVSPAPCGDLFCDVSRCVRNCTEIAGVAGCDASPCEALCVGACPEDCCPEGAACGSGCWSCEGGAAAFVC